MNYYKMEILTEIEGEEVSKTLKVKANSFANATMKVYKAYNVIAVINMTKLKF